MRPLLVRRCNWWDMPMQTYQQNTITTALKESPEVQVKSRLQHLWPHESMAKIGVRNGR